MIITVDFTDEEIAIIKEYAALHGVSVEEFIRQTVGMLIAKLRLHKELHEAEEEITSGNGMTFAQFQAKARENTNQVEKFRKGCKAGAEEANADDTN